MPATKFVYKDANEPTNCLVNSSIKTSLHAIGLFQRERELGHKRGFWQKSRLCNKYSLSKIKASSETWRRKQINNEPKIQLFQKNKQTE